jgi:hypothetical protein
VAIGGDDSVAVVGNSVAKVGHCELRQPINGVFASSSSFADSPTFVWGVYFVSGAIGPFTRTSRFTRAPCVAVGDDKVMDSIVRVQVSNDS